MYHKMNIYLSGPMSGSSEDSIVGWRQRVRAMLPVWAEVFDSALFPYDATSAYQLLEDSSAKLDRLMHGRLVVDRNKHIIQLSDVVFANFLGAERASVGSIGELFWANAFRVPIVIVREQTGNVHDHAMLNAIASVVANSLEEGCAAVLNMLGAKTQGGLRGLSQSANSRASSDES